MCQSSTISTWTVNIGGRVRIETRFKRTKMVTQPKKVDTGKLQQHSREFQVEIQNRFESLTSILSHNFDSRDDSIAKMIHND